VSESDRAAAKPEYQYQYILECPCGLTLEAATEDGIVERSQEHLRDAHPTMADTYERHHILFMARRVRI
jgi:hypothetical protein